MIIFENRIVRCRMADRCDSMSLRAAFERAGRPNSRRFLAALLQTWHAGCYLPLGPGPRWLDGEENAMMSRPTRRAFLLGTLALGLPSRAGADGFPGGFGEVFGPRFGARSNLRDLRQHRRPGAGAMDRLRHWNEIAIDASGLDHTPVPPRDSRIFGEQVGPGPSRRAMAIVHIAVFDAMNAIVGGYQSYTGLRPAHDDTSVEAAIALAAHDTLIALFPSQKADLDEALVDDLATLRDGRAKANGVTIGQLAAARILARRANDGSNHAEPRVGVDFFTSDEP